MMKPAIPEAVLKKHTAVFGMTGSGKTSTEKLLIEQVVASGARVCILDPIKSDHWGLTSNKSGNGPGLPFQILGGPHGHVPLHAGAGEAIAELVANGKLPLSIIDMSDFGVGGLQRFFNDFAPMLMRKMRGVLYLVIEEAHEFAPKEKSGAGGENMATYNAKKLATAGRSKGIRLIVASQRVQALHNAVIGSCETMIVHRMSDPADQEPVTKRLKGTVRDRELREQIERSIPELADGEGWICSGSAKILERVQFPRIHTFDNSATPEDDRHRAHVVMAKVDVQQLRELVGDAVDEAASNDPAALKKEIADLRSQLAAKSAGPTPEQLAGAEDRGFVHGSIEAAQAWRAKVAKQFELLRHWLSLAEKEMSNEQVRSNGSDGANLETRGFLEHEIPRAASRSIDMTKINAGSPTVSDIPKGEVAILAACIAYPEGLRREQLTVIVGYKKSSRDAYIARLAGKGFVSTGELVRATDAGRRALPDAAPLPRGRALQDVWRQRLPEGERKILEALIGAFPAAVDRQDLEDLVGFKKSSRDAYLSRLAAKQLVTAPSRGEVRASEDLF